MTDREIIDFIKKDIVKGDVVDSLTLDIVWKNEDCDPNSLFCDSDSDIFDEMLMDELIGTLFELSLTHEISSVSPVYSTQAFCRKAINGHLYPIVGYTFVVEKSKTHQTNITPRLMKFVELFMRRDVINALTVAYPSSLWKGGKKPIEVGFRDDVPFEVFQSDDPWETVEAYLNEGADDEKET